MLDAQTLMKQTLMTFMTLMTQTIMTLITLLTLVTHTLMSSRMWTWITRVSTLVMLATVS